MNADHVKYLRCPRTGAPLSVEAHVTEHGRVREGLLRSASGGHTYPIVGFIPRFVPVENYAANFGLQWKKHRRTQLDDQSGTALSRTRFFDESKWEPRLEGELALEAGCGAGRFTGHAASTGAMICAFDYSEAVEAAYETHGHLPNVLFAQGDIFQMPFPKASFDRVFCFGVLQHTPDPGRAFQCVAEMVRPGGALAIDVYKKKRFTYLHLTKYWVRPVTRTMNPEKLYRLVIRYIDFMWPLATQIRKLGKWGIQINWRLLVADHSHWGVPENRLKDWAYLDTFDMLSPRFDLPQTLETVQRWFETAGFAPYDVHYGYNGIEGRGRRLTRDP